MKKRISIILLCVMVLSTSVFIAGCEKKDKLSVNNNEKLENLKLPGEKGKYIGLNLYFRSTDSKTGSQPVKEERLIQKDELIGETIIQNLIKGPSVAGDSKPILPKEARLLTFSIKDGTAYINLSREAKEKMSRDDEFTSLKCIAMSLTQIDSIKKIQIQIENQNVDTLGGNYDISKPFDKDGIKLLKK